MKEVNVFGGFKAMVDDDDYDVVSSVKWHLVNGYAVRHTPKNKDKKKEWILMHRLIMGIQDDMQIDHINHNKLDNQKSNLRIVTVQQNGFNQKPQIGCYSKHKGVTFRKRDGMWQAQIKYNKIRTYLGIYKNENDAARAYNRAAKNLFGEFAFLNEVSV